MNTILNRQGAKVAKKDYFRGKKFGVLGVLAVQCCFLNLR